MTNYITSTICLIEKNEHEKLSKFAEDLPNLNFYTCKQFLAEMGKCFEQPVVIAGIIRLLKSTDEPIASK